MFLPVKGNPFTCIPRDIPVILRLKPSRTGENRIGRNFGLLHRNTFWEKILIKVSLPCR